MLRHECIAKLPAPVASRTRERLSERMTPEFRRSVTVGRNASLTHPAARTGIASSSALPER